MWKLRRNIKSRTESTGGGVNLKTVTEIRPSCTRNSFLFLVNNVYFCMMNVEAESIKSRAESTDSHRDKTELCA